MLKPGRARGAAPGFTLVELMIAITVTGILLVIGVPALRGVVENTRIRAVSESMKYGLDLARNEAVRLNTQVEFVSGATGWEVRRVADGTVLHAGTGREGGSALVTLTITPQDADRVTFDSFGRALATNPDGTAALTQVDVESVTPSTASGYRPLTVQVLAGGVTRLCDPAVDATDPRVCM